MIVRTPAFKMEICPRCGTRLLQDIRTWSFMEEIKRHVCPICVFQGAAEEDPKGWLNFRSETEERSCIGIGVGQGDA
ncbi:MAG: hypothetical protein V1875_04485 [Candidatus Altiarchaeota archaeon]